MRCGPFKLPLVSPKCGGVVAMWLHSAFWLTGERFRCLIWFLQDTVQSSLWKHNAIPQVKPGVAGVWGDASSWVSVLPE